MRAVSSRLISAWTVSPNCSRLYQKVTTSGNSTNWLLQLRVLRFGLFQDRDVGVGVFPEREEALINAPFHIVEDLFLAQKIQVGVTAGTHIDDCRKVA